jgi:hypothetical protein
MWTKYKYLIIVPLAGLLYAGCKKIDNYPAPSSGIYGTLTDAETGDPLVLPVGEGTIRLLEQNPLYPNPTPIGLSVNSKSAYYATQLFADQYKVFPLALSGPFTYPSGDTVLVMLSPNALTQVNFQVTPYYRIAASVSDTTITYTITSSLANDSLGSQLTNVYFLISQDSALNMGTAGTPPGNYYPNQFPLSNVSNAMLGVQQTFSIPFATTHLSPGLYYFRVTCAGSNSDGQYNYSQTLSATVD